MKFILSLMAMLVAFPVAAQEFPDIYRPATPAQISGFSGSARYLTTRTFNRVVRVTCTQDCLINFSPFGQSLAAQVTDGIFIPANVPAHFRVSPQARISVIADSVGGTIHVLELSR